MSTIGDVKRRQYEALLESIPKDIVMEKAASYIAQSMMIESNNGVITDPDSAIEFARLLTITAERERFIVVLLDNQHQVIDYKVVFEGTINAASVYPREVVKIAMSHNAAACFFIHNHPSGDPEPSQADRRITRRLSDALALIEVRVIDHLVVGGQTGEVCSFAKRNWI